MKLIIINVPIIDKGNYSITDVENFAKENNLHLEKKPPLSVTVNEKTITLVFEGYEKQNDKDKSVLDYLKED